MKEIAIVFIFCLVPICLFGMAAFLIYRQVDGWGWFLFVVIMICGSMKFSTGD